MGRRYNLDDLDVPTLPRISKGAWRFGTRLYHWRCVGRTSTGYGTTPMDAYSSWLSNWARRLKWYRRQRDHARAVLASMGM